MTFKQILQQRAKKSQSTKVIKKIPLYDVLLAPMITEKTHKQQESLNKYTFKVNSASNKNDVKEAFVALYKITPLKVNVVSVVFKGRNNRKLVRRAYKKAIITLSQKDKIDVAA